MDSDDFAARQRSGEYFHDVKLPPGVWAVVRVDGRGFAKLTARHYEKPYDAGLSAHMVATARALVTDLGGVYGYTQSDEVSVLLAPGFDQFGRGVEKLVSLSAGLASATFTAAAGLPATFDSRVWIGAGAADVVDYFSWRQADAARSALNNWCYWTVRQAGGSARQATAALHRAGTQEKNELLHRHGVNFNDVPAWQRRGFGLIWQEYDKHATDRGTGVSVVARRRRLHVERELPMKDEYRRLVAGIADVASKA